MKRLSALVLAASLACTSAIAKDYILVSPNGTLRLTVKVDEGISYSLGVAGLPALSDCHIGMDLSDGTRFGVSPVVVKVNRGAREDVVQSPLYRQSKVSARYNYMTLKMEGDYAIQFRAYNEGVAYRFVTTIPDQITIHSETCEFNFAQPFDMYVPYVSTWRPDKYRCDFESLYTYHKADAAPTDTVFAFTPVLVQMAEGKGWLHIMESNVEDYPGMFLRHKGCGFVAEFPPIPETYELDKRAVRRPVKYTDDIAWTEGSRNYPWRILAYSAQDTDIVSNNMVYLTSTPSKVEDVSWIAPGLSTWDWWNSFTLVGVDFVAGINTATYKHHIDFASEYGIPYVLMDEGWYRNNNPFEINEDLDLEYLFEYAQESNVKLVLWMSCDIFWKDAENICSHYSKKGVAGFKVDFFDSQNQETVKQVYEMAEVAAKYHQVLDLHGFYKPTGMSRAYPNVLNYEGVYGLEKIRKDHHDNCDMPHNDVLISYIRMVAGPVDYTQGAMRNEHRKSWTPRTDLPISQGTRAHQVALYVVFDSPYAMLCDSPSWYEREPETTGFIARIPTVASSMRSIDGKVGQYNVVLREKDGKFYVGGITNSEERDVELSFDFLPEGDFTATVYRDGANAQKVASDHKIETITVNKGVKLSIHMASGGGFAIIVE